jgi:hypothetical protein
MAQRPVRSARFLALLVGALALGPKPASAAPPDACRRTGEHAITVLLRLAPRNVGTLASGPGGQLRLKMRTGSDPCGGTVNEIFSFWVNGSRRPDVFAIRGSRALERGSYNFSIRLRGDTDRLRLVGTNHGDRVTFFVADTSDGPVEMFDWKRVGFARVFRVNRVSLLGRKGDDALRGNPPGPPRHFPESARRPMRILGGPGDDTAVGGRRNVKLVGWSGKDFILGGKGDDLIRGGPGRDTCSGGGGSDTVTGCE